MLQAGYGVPKQQPSSPVEELEQDGGAVSDRELANGFQRRSARDLKSTTSFSRMSRGVQQAARLRMHDDTAGSSQWRQGVDECVDLVRAFRPSILRASAHQHQGECGVARKQTARSVYPAERMQTQMQCQCQCQCQTLRCRPAFGPQGSLLAPAA